MRKIVLELERMRKKEEAHTYLAEVFSFPEYYGRNLDAFADLLSEKLAAQACEICLEGYEGAEQDLLGYARGVIKVLQDIKRAYPDRLIIELPEEPRY